MVLKVIDAVELREGSFIILENDSFAVKNIEISKTGKHGHAKVRFDALSVTDGKKKCIVVPGHERFEVPMIEKKKAQVLSIAGTTASLMDLDSFENFDMQIPEEMKAELKDGQTIEYWDVEGRKLIKKIM
jgi:translation initiation factor 5A